MFVQHQNQVVNSSGQKNYKIVVVVSRPSGANWGSNLCSAQVWLQTNTDSPIRWSDSMCFVAFSKDLHDDDSSCLAWLAMGQRNGGQKKTHQERTLEIGHLKSALSSAGDGPLDKFPRNIAIGSVLLRFNDVVVGDGGANLFATLRNPTWPPLGLIRCLVHLAF